MSLKKLIATLFVFKKPMAVYTEQPNLLKGDRLHAVECEVFKLVRVMHLQVNNALNLAACPAVSEEQKTRLQNIAADLIAAKRILTQCTEKSLGE